MNGQVKSLDTEHYPSGALYRKQMADGTWSGVYLYNGAGQLASIDNAAVASASEPSSFISAMAYNAAGQTAAITYGNPSR